MSTERPTSAEEMIAWLRAHPGEPFFTLYSKDRLIVGTRNDDGELWAWDCTVTESAFEVTRRRLPPSRRSRGRGET